MRDIVKGEGDDPVLGESVLLEDLVGVVDVGLVAVVGVGVGTGDQDGPVLAGGEGEQAGEQDEEAHWLIDWVFG